MEIKPQNKMLMNLISYDYKVHCWYCNKCKLEIGICECTDMWVRVDDVQKLYYDMWISGNILSPNEFNNKIEKGD